VLLHYPRWGAPVHLLAWCPEDWGFTTPSHFGFFFPLPVFPMKKPVSAPTGRGTLSAQVDDLVERFPCLAEHLAANAYDGEPAGTRATSTLLVFAQDGSWKGCLRDRQEGRCLWVASPTFFDLFGVLEDALANGAAVWRDDRMGGAPEAKRQNGKKAV